MMAFWQGVASTGIGTSHEDEFAMIPTQHFQECG